MHFSIENPEIKVSLERIWAIIVQHGGYAHPNLTLHQSCDRLWVSCSQSNPSETLLHVPLALFIPITPLQWSYLHGEIRYIDHASVLSAAQRQLLDDMLQIYRLTDKVALHQKTALPPLLETQPTLLSWFSGAWSGYVLPHANPVLDFLATRWIRLNKTQKDERHYIMPVIDLINHHPYGPKIQNDGQHLTLKTFHANSSAEECCWCYNGSDSLSIAYHHGYLETHTDYLAALDCRLHHALIGDVHVMGNDDNRRALNAPSVGTVANTLTLQSIVLQQAQLPSLSTLLALAVRSKNRTLDQQAALQVAHNLIAQMIQANKVSYTQLLEICQSSTASHPMFGVLNGVAKHQLQLLNNMKTHHDSLSGHGHAY